MSEASCYQRHSKTDAAIRLLTLPLFMLTIFLSAVLLFGVQPMFAKMVLPRLGGSSGVWSVAMVFFQGMLLLGYAYAHLISMRLAPWHAVIAHLTLMALACLFLPLSIASGWDHPPQSGTSLWLIALFAASIGLPFFAISANGPLLQAWFSRTGHAQAHDPYFLYGASNLGSFASLLLYPLLIEPGLALGSQSRMWSAGFVLLAGLLAASGITMLRAGAAMTVAPALPEQPSTGVTGRRRLAWIALAFVPSGLLVATTAHISTDVAAAPFMWVVPLALFLLTFVIVFRERVTRIERLFGMLLPALVLGVLSASLFGFELDWITGFALNTAAFFACALAAHRTLYDLRPDASRLTEFYLFMSLGGVLGGIFSGLVAPAVFSSVAEYPLLLVLALACRPSALRTSLRTAVIEAVAVALACVLIGALGSLDVFQDQETRKYLLFATLIAAMIAPMFDRDGPLVILLALGIIAAGFLLDPSGQGREVRRSFFGVHKIDITPDGQYRLLTHGTTTHGAQRLSDSGQRPQALTYYHRDGPIAQALATVQDNAPDAHVAVVGLGIGSLACYKRPGEAWTYYEIDPVVVEIARDANRFSFLSACGEDTRIVLGDARLTLRDVSDDAYDIIVVDAFSSDAIPTHLLTTEAFALYASKLRQGGIAVVHISNRHLDLLPVVGATASANDLVAIYRHDPGEGGTSSLERSASLVAVVGEAGNSVMDQLRANGWRAITRNNVAPWTDDYSNIPGAVIRMMLRQAR